MKVEDKFTDWVCEVIKGNVELAVKEVPKPPYDLCFYGKYLVDIN